MKEILPKSTFAYEFFEIAMGCGQHTYIHGNGPVAADKFDFALLQHSQQGDLNIRRQIQDFIQNAPPSCDLLRVECW